MQAGTRFTYPGGMEGRVDLVDLIVPWPAVEPVTFRSRVQRSTNAMTKKRWLDHADLTNITAMKHKLLVTQLETS